MAGPQDRYEGRVPRELDGARLEVVLDELLFDATRSQIQRLVRRGAVRIDGHRVRRTGERIPAGCRVRVDFEAAQASRERRDERADRKPVLRASDLVVVYEDEHLAVVDKPAGLLTHGRDAVTGDRAGGAGGARGLAGSGGAAGRRGRSQGGPRRTGSRTPQAEPDLAALAVERFGPLPILMGAERPGIVHRLDRWTSGLVVVAKSDQAMGGLREAFRERSVHKAYLAVVHGDPGFDEAVLDQDLVDGRDQRRGWRPRGQGDQAAETEVEVLERFGHVALVLCRPRTGRRHQLRVHLLAAGLPIVGDELYAGRRAPRLPEGAPRVRRQLLHAVGLAFAHPVTGEEFGFEAPAPADLQELLDWFEA